MGSNGCENEWIRSWEGNRIGGEPHLFYLFIICIDFLALKSLKTADIGQETSLNVGFFCLVMEAAMWEWWKCPLAEHSITVVLLSWLPRRE